MKEAGAVISMDMTVTYWHAPDDRSMGALPDSRTLWDVIWENRDRVKGFAHTHPGSGVPGPSYEDVTTFSAIELGLGRRLDWWISSSDRTVLIRWVGPHEHQYEELLCTREPEWVEELRRISMPEVEGHPV